MWFQKKMEDIDFVLSHRAEELAGQKPVSRGLGLAVYSRCVEEHMGGHDQINLGERHIIAFHMVYMK